MNKVHLAEISKLNEIVRQDGGAKMIAQSFINSCDGNKHRAWSSRLESEHFYTSRLNQNLDRKLSGLIVGVKDNIATQDFPTLMGSPVAWKNHNMGFDARIISKLKYEGAVVGGKNQTSEFAVHAKTDVINPRYPHSECGTSSAGSAAAVASGEVSISIATQTAGSIARPASYCGVIGFKPSFGELPRTGVLKTTDLFDSVGFISNSIRDLRIVFDTLRVQGLNHPTHVMGENKFDGILLISDDRYDLASDYIRAQVKSQAVTLSEMLNIPISTPDSNFELSEFRNNHALIYRRDLLNYFKDELKGEGITETMKEFLGDVQKTSQEKYEDALSHILEWRRTFQEKTKGKLVLSVGANFGAPDVDPVNHIDCNSMITASLGPQIVLPVMRDQAKRLVGLSLSASKGMDMQLLEIADRMFPKTCLELESYQ